jgi:subtilisin family serine protease
MPTRRSRSTRGTSGTPRDEEYFTDLIYRYAGRARYTQDSPILADVFVHYGLKNDENPRLGVGPKGSDDFRLDLLITPHLARTAAQLARHLHDRLTAVEPDAPRRKRGGSKSREVDADAVEPYCITSNQSVVAIRLTFEELLRHVLPMSWWWRNRLIAVEGLTVEQAYNDPVLQRSMREQLIEGLKRTIEHGAVATRGQRWLIQDDFIWAARVFYLVQHSNRDGKPDGSDENAAAMAKYFLDHIVGWVAAQTKKTQDEQSAQTDRYRSAVSAQPSDTPWTYTVNRNRPVALTVFDSMRTMKADAATRTFEATGKGIRWAIIDSGVDATHPAFRRSDGDGQRHARAFERDPRSPSGWRTNTRVKKTYDFSAIRQRLPNEQRRALITGKMLDWGDIIKQLGLEKPFGDTPYETPGQAHGTHVAGILAADWRPDETDFDPLGPRQTTRKPAQPLVGVCPDIELYDLRVFDDDGQGDEFSVISALQFVRWLNQQHESIEIHGVNLSLAMTHEVSNYACGRSPVCEECTRLVGNGVVVVAAAGNDGRSVYTTTQGRRADGYRAISIADPGNAEVGSTHRREPHTYGVSYFSSRGPTGDGRTKPDLVAPGEKITSTVPGGALAQQDGTSQAAPHVSGAAALLMSRHTEFIGQPAKIKAILMKSAIDLGRERIFQGAGLIDVFGAMQSV